MRVEDNSGTIMLVLLVLLVLCFGQCELKERVEKLETQVTEAIK